MNDDHPWCRPVASGIPNRPGDREEQPIYAALGRAVSNWEGISAATASLFRALLEEDDRSELNSDTVEAFGGINNVHKRAKQLKDHWERFFNAEFQSERDEALHLRDQLPQLMAAYRGWAERRNDLAHGYVTSAEGPDYEFEDQRTITSYALCPSHARLLKWHHSEPEFNYIASEIVDFAHAFRALDDEIEAVAERIEALRAWRTTTQTNPGGSIA